ncbi:MAG: U32 family peptidase, partial [Lentisphaeria bacterium]
MNINNFYKPELLAPAGREDVFYAVLEAGADAVYLSGKQFNMRRHRNDYNFSDEKLLELINYAHARQKRVYVTVNTLIGNREIAELESYLLKLEQMNVDALIVQDFAVVEMCKRLEINIALHASTMMNVNSVDQALMLKRLGFERVVTSRDITLESVRRIKDGSGIEVEYFIHGDMCSVQSGQCHQSGQIFGKSSNRGQCMKPCRWKYDLVGRNSGAVLADGAYLLAAKDLCVLNQIPDLIKSGCDSLKIEGRMKPANMLYEIVLGYRKVIDSYINNPLSKNKSDEAVGNFYRNRVRDFSSGFTFKNPNNEFMDYGGAREPIFLSYFGRMHNVENVNGNFQKLTGEKKSPKISVFVGNYATALAAIESGVERIIISWEGELQSDSGWELSQLSSLIKITKDRGIDFVLATPRIMAQDELEDFYQIVRMYPEINKYLLSGIGPINKLKTLGKSLMFDSSCNILNLEAVNFFKKCGAVSITPGVEASFNDIAEMINY